MTKNYPHGWYAIALSAELKPGKPLALKRFGADFVLWRDRHQACVIQRDLCPHRSVKLSLGEITRDFTLACPFHGMQFDRGGACLHVPETGKPATALCLETFHTCEAHGFIWLWLGDGEPREDQPPWFEELTADYVHATIAEYVNCHVTRAIENQLDFVHLAFVHKTTIGRGFDPTRKARVEADDRSIKYSVQAQERFTDSSIHFKMPNIWLNTITKKFRIMLAFCPIDENRTKIYLRTYQSFLTLPLLGKAVLKLMNLSNRVVFRQDSRIVNSHPGGSSLATGDSELLFAGDQPIRQFRRIWNM